jgi:hypothetical protein
MLLLLEGSVWDQLAAVDLALDRLVEVAAVQAEEDDVLSKPSVLEHAKGTLKLLRTKTVVDYFLAYTVTCVIYVHGHRSASLVVHQANGCVAIHEKDGRMQSTPRTFLRMMGRVA